MARSEIVLEDGAEAGSVEISVNIDADGDESGDSIKMSNMTRAQQIAAVLGKMLSDPRKFDDAVEAADIGITVKRPEEEAGEAEAGEPAEAFEAEAIERDAAGEVFEPEKIGPEPLKVEGLSAGEIPPELAGSIKALDAEGFRKMMLAGRESEAEAEAEAEPSHVRNVGKLDADDFDSDFDSDPFA